MRLLLITIALAVVTTPSFAQTKQPWEWTDDERVAAHEKRYAVWRERAAVEGEHGDSGESIEGRSNPHLFFPHELFRHLLSRGVSENPEVRAFVKELHRDGVRSAGFPDDFWERLERLAQPFLEARRLNAQLNEKLRGLTPSEEARMFDERMAVGRANCRGIFAALENARAEFGRERVDRFLYEHVARTFNIGRVRPENPEVLRYRAKGCP